MPETQFGETLSPREGFSIIKVTGEFKDATQGGKLVDSFSYAYAPNTVATIDTFIVEQYRNAAGETVAAKTGLPGVYDFAYDSIKLVVNRIARQAMLAHFEGPDATLNKLVAKMQKANPRKSPEKVRLLAQAMLEPD